MVVGATACVEREQVPPQRAAATADPALQKAERLPFSPAWGAYWVAVGSQHSTCCGSKH